MATTYYSALTMCLQALAHQDMSTEPWHRVHVPSNYEAVLDHYGSQRDWLVEWTTMAHNEIG